MTFQSKTLNTNRNANSPQYERRETKYGRGKIKRMNNAKGKMQVVYPWAISSKVSAMLSTLVRTLQISRRRNTLVRWDRARAVSRRSHA